MSEPRTFDNLPSTNHEHRQPIFLICDHSWSGWWWDGSSGSGLQRELRHVAENAKYVIREAQHGYSASHTLQLAAGVEAKVNMPVVDCIEAAAAAAFAHEFAMREVAGVVWYQTAANADHSSWTCAFGDHDAGEVTVFHSTSYVHWTVKRILVVGETRFELLSYDSCEHGLDEFDVAALRCHSLFLDLLRARGGDSFAAGVKEGADSMRAKILDVASRV